MNNIAPAQQQTHGFSEAQVAAENAAFMRKVYAIMAAGLCVTAIAALVVANSPTLTRLIIGNRPVFYGLLFAELGMVWLFASWADRMSAVGAAALFYTYAVTNGLTLSVFFLIYTTASIATCFWITAGTFGGMSIYGYLTKRDLSGVGHFMIMGLWGLIIASVVNLFMGNQMIYWATSFFGVFIFVGLTAYDTQKIKQLNIIGNQGTDEDHKEAIHGALILYLDFVNLFLYLLRLLGRRR
jgi:FtsH-binding integral membrane protein